MTAEAGGRFFSHWNSCDPGVTEKKKKKDIHTKLTLIPLEGCKHRKVMQIREPEQIRFKLTIVVLLPVLLLLMNDSVESIWKFNIQ